MNQERLEEFRKIWKQWDLGVQSMMYQLKKNGRTPAFLREQEKFEKGITAKMDEAWRRLAPFEQETFWAEKKGGKNGKRV